MKVVSIVGNRPQFVKAAPLCRALRARVDEVLVHSGQHYDPELADLIFDELGIQRESDFGLGHGGMMTYPTTETRGQTTDIWTPPECQQGRTRSSQMIRIGC